MPKAIIVDDQQSICWGLSKLCDRMGWESEVFSSMEDLMKAYPMPSIGSAGTASSAGYRTAVPSVVFLDVRLPGMDGLSGTEEVRRRWADIPVVIMTAFGDLQTAVKTVKIQAFEYLVKPFELQKVQELLSQIRQLDPSRQRTKENIGEGVVPNEGFIGNSLPMQEVFKKIAQTTKLDAPVFISGESGTGKELTARSIHKFGKRNEHRFIPVNIAALNPNLVESELFGHVAGAFTGAANDKPGLIEQANGGTLFLDEVADIPLDLQVKLLRVLDLGEVVRVGDRVSRTVDFRLISATHQDLKEKVRTGKFRHDLYYRICSFQIDLPPLRDHLEDLPQLVQHFLNQLRPGGYFTWTNDFIRELSSRPWPGNIRQLRTAVEYAVVSSRNNTLRASDLPSNLPDESNALPGSGASFFSSGALNHESFGRLKEEIEELFHSNKVTEKELQNFVSQLIRLWTRNKLQDPEDGKIYSEFLAWVESPLIRQTVEHCDGQALAAARRLGIHRTTVKKKLEIGLEKEAQSKADL